MGAGLGRALRLDHSHLVGLTAAAVLQASNITLLLRRSLRRLGGTIAGVALAGAVFALHPAVIAVATVATLAQFAAEVVMRVSYGLAVTFVTVIALCVYDLAAPGAATSAVGARVLDTAIGAALAIMLRLVLWPRAARMPQVQAQTLRTVASVFRSRWLSDQTGLERAQRQLQKQLPSARMPPPDAHGSVELPGYPRTQAATELLASADAAAHDLARAVV